MAASWIFLITSLLFCFGPAYAYTNGKLCSTSRSLEWCDYGCCSYGCCPNVLAAWTIAVIVIGCIIFVSIVVAVICCVVKSSGSRGVVVHPVQPTSGVTVLSTAQSSQMAAWQQQGQYGPPQPYGGYTYGPNQGYIPGQPVPPPPAYSDPAYPPGQSNASPFAAAATKGPQ